MNFMPTPETPFSSIVLDHTTVSQSEYDKYIGNVIDFATHFIVPGAVSTIYAKEVIQHLYMVFYHYGVPDDCLSDYES